MQAEAGGFEDAQTRDIQHVLVACTLHGKVFKNSVGG